MERDRQAIPADHVEFAAQSCFFCERACGEAALRLAAGSPISCPPLLQALVACRRLLRLNLGLLRERSPLHPLMCAACVGACVLVCKAAELASQAREDALLKEVSDTCWIAAHACRELVNAEVRPPISAARPPGRAV
jgi:hypothetical protein